MWLVVFILDDTWYFLNVFTQTIGYHFQWLMQLGWHCDAFEQLGKGYCADNNGTARAVYEGVAIPTAAQCFALSGVFNYTNANNEILPVTFRWIPSVGAANDGKSADPMWMSWWTIFYWGWWIAWAPFVGIFLARISRNRTIREVVHYTLTAPFLYSCTWFAVFGGAGIKMHRTAVAQEAQATALGVLEQIRVTGPNHGDACYSSAAVMIDGKVRVSRRRWGLLDVGPGHA